LRPRRGPGGREAPLSPMRTARTLVRVEAHDVREPHERAERHDSQTIEAQSPAMTPTSQRLLAEHPQPLRSIDEIIESIRVVAPFDIPFQSLLSRSRAFTRELAKHESRENEILMRALDDDSGALDRGLRGCHSRRSASIGSRPAAFLA